MFDSKKPQPDQAEHEAYFPSEFSLGQYVSPKSDFADAVKHTVSSGPRKVLLIATDERYLPVEDGKLFSTGNHPVETLVPMYHLREAGFDFDIATVSGNGLKFEFWAMPDEDEAITGLHRDLLARFEQPLKLSDVAAALEQGGADYAAVFIPGGHGPLIGLPFSKDVAAVLRWALAKDRHIVSICHGPAALLACETKDGQFPFAGRKITAFPDDVDRMSPEIGYMPGHLTWQFGARLESLGVEIVNSKPDQSTHADGKLLTGASPFAANELGKLAASELLAAHAEDRGA